MAGPDIEAPAALATRFVLSHGVSQLSASFGEPVALDRMREVWERLVASNAVLRTGFRTGAGGKLFQNEAPEGTVAWQELDWSAMPREELAAGWTALLAAESEVVIPAGGPPLIRAMAIRLPGGPLHLLATYPAFLLTEEDWFFLLCEIVEGLEGRWSPPQTEPQPELGLQPSGDRNWWTSLLGAGRPPLLVHYLSTATVDAPAWQTTLMDRETTRAFVDACRRADVAVPTALLGLWGLIVARKTSQPEALVLATPLPASEHPLPCRIRIDPTGTLLSHLKALADDERVRSAASGTSIGHLEWGPGDAVSATDFTALFEFKPPSLNDRIPDAYPRWINMDARILDHPVHPLTLEARDGHRLALRLHAAALDARAAADLLGEMELAVRAFAGRPSVKIADCWSDDVHELTARRPEPPVAPAAIHDTISEEATASADAVAAEDPGGGTLTYREMEDHASRLAGFFAKESLTEGWTIGVCVAPSTWVPVALLGILRAGNTCLPLDPGCAPGWLGAQLEGADCELVICDSTTEALLAESGRRRLVIDRDWATVAGCEHATPPEEPAKVAVLLAGTDAVPPPQLRAFAPTFLAACCARTARRAGLGRGDRVVVTAPAGSAAFLEGILAALASGATAVLAGTDADALRPDIGGTHVRLTADEFRASVASLQRSGESLADGALRLVAVDVAGGFLPSRVVAGWEAVSGGVPLVVFASPCGFLGIGLQIESSGVDSALDAVPAGMPTASSGCSFTDPIGRRPLPGYPGHLNFHPTFGEPIAANWPAWRDRLGRFHLIAGQLQSRESGLFALADVLDAAVDPARPTLAWVVCAKGADIAIEPDADVRILVVDRIPLRHGRRDLQALMSPQAPRKPVARAAVAPATPEREAGQPVLRPSSEPALPLLRMLGGNPDAPLLVIVDPEGRDTHPICKVLEGDWALAAIHCPVGTTDPARLALRIAPILPTDVPLHFLGLGEAGMVAFEIARILRASGREVPYLAIAGTLPPAPQRRTGWLGNLVRGRQAREAASYHPEPLEGPCGIIFTGDLPDEAWHHWLALAPDALTQRTGRSLSELLGPDPEDLAELLSGFSGEE